MARRSDIPWDLIEKQYRLGTKTASQIAAEFGVAVSTITRKAEAKGWVQDKREEVDVLTNSLLIQSASGNANPNATPSALEIKVAAQAAADVVLEHRQGLRRLKKLHADLLAQMEGVVGNMVAIDEIIQMVRREDDRGVDRANDALRRAMERPQLVEDLKKLADIDERIRKGEREAYDLDKEKDKGSAYEDLLARLGAQAAAAE